MADKYVNRARDELLRLLVARDRGEATRFGLVWEANEIERDKALNADFVALDLLPDSSVGGPPTLNVTSLTTWNVASRGRRQQKQIASVRPPTALSTRLRPALV